MAEDTTCRKRRGCVYLAHFPQGPRRAQDEKILERHALVCEIRLLGGGTAVRRLPGRCAFEVANGQIPLSYLLDGDVRDPNSANGFCSQASTGRAQTLVVTLIVAGY